MMNWKPLILHQSGRAIECEIGRGNKALMKTGETGISKTKFRREMACMTDVPARTALRPWMRTGPLIGIR